MGVCMHVCVCLYMYIDTHIHFIDRQTEQERGRSYMGKVEAFQIESSSFQGAIYFSPSAPEVLSEPTRYSQEASLNA